MIDFTYFDFGVPCGRSFLLNLCRSGRHAKGRIADRKKESRSRRTKVSNHYKRPAQGNACAQNGAELRRERLAEVETERKEREQREQEQVRSPEKKPESKGSYLEVLWALLALCGPWGLVYVFALG